MNFTRSLIGSVVASVSLLLASTALASHESSFVFDALEGERVHVVKKGETLTGIMKRYLGDARFAYVLQRQNAGFVRPLRPGNVLWPGDQVVIPPIKGNTAGMAWKDITPSFGAVELSAVDIDAKGKQWLVGGKGGLYSFDGSRVKNLSTQAKKAAALPVKYIHHDGERFWIVSGTFLGSSSLTTFNGKTFADMSNVLTAEQTRWTEWISGTKEKGLVFAGGKGILVFVKDGVAQDLSPALNFNESDAWKYTWFFEPAFNGTEWMIPFNGNLYHFDGTTVKNLTDASVWDAYVDSAHRGVTAVAWDKDAKKWVVSTGWHEEGQLQTKFLNVDPVSLAVSVRDFGETDTFFGPYPTARPSPFGWILTARNGMGGHNAFAVWGKGKQNRVSFARDVAGSFACSTTMCLAVPSTASGEVGAVLKWEAGKK